MARTIRVIDDTYDTSDWNGEDDAEYSSESCSCEHDDEYEERGEVECLTHDIRYEEVILYALDDEIEGREYECCLPWYTESDDHCWDECDKWSDIRDEFHDTTDERECKCLFRIITEYPLHEKESYIRCREYTHTQYECCLHPCGSDILYRLVVILEISLDTIRSYLEKELPETIALEHHEECRDSDESPVRYDTTYGADEWETAARERSYLCRHERLDIAGILLDEVEGMFDVILSEDQEDDTFDIWMKMKSLNSFFEVYRLRAIYPCDDKCRCLRYIVDDYRYQCPDDYSAEYEHDDIYTYECHPWWYTMTQSDIDKRIHHDSEKTCNKYEYDNRRK